MVTKIDMKCVGTDVTFTFVGKSTDKKPNTSNGSKFIELDTGDELFFDGDEKGWSKQADKYLVSIAVTTAPTKTEYFEGDSFDATGMVVAATYTDDSTKTITDYEVEAPEVLTVADTKVGIVYVENGRTRKSEQSIKVDSIEIASIEITTDPTKDSYTVGDALDLTGIKVTATYNNGTTEDITASCSFSPQNGTQLTEAGDVTITATYNELTDTTTVTVAEPPVLKSVAYTGSPKVSYVAGEQLDLTGAEITATYTDDSTAVVTDQCTFSPEEGTVLTVENNRVTASYTEGEVTKTTYKVLTVTAE